MKLGTFTFEITSLIHKTMKSRVIFDIYQKDDHFVAVPFLNETELRLAHLPPAITFFLKDGRVVTSDPAVAANTLLMNAISQHLGQTRAYIR